MSTLLFPLIFLIMGCLLLWILIGCKGWWSAKWWMMNLTAIMILLLWKSVTSYMGWPTDTETPETFKLVGFYSQEPKALFVFADVEGEIGRKSILDYFCYESNDPVRLYKLPYNKELHENLEAAMERILKGGYVIASKQKILDAEEIRKYQKEQQNQGSSNSGAESLAERLNFYVLPPSIFMKKPYK